MRIARSSMSFQCCSAGSLYVPTAFAFPVRKGFGRLRRVRAEGPRVSDTGRLTLRLWWFEGAFIGRYHSSTMLSFPRNGS